MNTRRSSVGVGVVGGKLTNDIKKKGGGNAIFFFSLLKTYLRFMFLLNLVVQMVQTIGNHSTWFDQLLA